MNSKNLYGILLCVLFAAPATSAMNVKLSSPQIVYGLLTGTIVQHNSGVYGMDRDLIEQWCNYAFYEDNSLITQTKTKNDYI